MTTDATDTGRPAYNGKPEVEDGATQIANELLAELPRKKYGFGQQEHSLFLAIFRYTYGMGRTWTDASFAELARFADIRPNHAGQVIRSLLERNVLKYITIQPGNRVAIQFNKYYNEWIPKKEWLSRKRSSDNLSPDSARTSRSWSPPDHGAPESKRLKNLQILEPSRSWSPPDHGAPPAAAVSITLEPGVTSFPDEYRPGNGVSSPDASLPHARMRAIMDSHERERSHASTTDLGSGEVMLDREKHDFQTGSLSHESRACAHEDPASVEGALNSREARPGGRNSGDHPLGRVSLPKGYEEAFPGELDWLLDSLGLKSYSDFGFPRNLPKKRSFDVWISYQPENRRRAYDLAGENGAEKAFSYALKVLKTPKKEVTRSGRASGTAGQGSTPGRPKRDWNAVFGQRPSTKDPAPE